MAALAEAGVERRSRHVVMCPLDPDHLRRRVEQGMSIAALAAEQQVSSGTARRWLAAAGLLPPDPDLPPKLLRRLYVEQGMSTRAIAEQVGISRTRVVHGMAGAGIVARGYSARHAGGGREQITDAVLAELHVEQGLTLRVLAAQLGVTPEYLSSRCHEAGIVPRPGVFGPRTAYSAGELAEQAGDLYGDGLNVNQVAERLGVSSSTVLAALHEARVPMRVRGYRGLHEPPRTLVADLYSDPDIRSCLRRHHVRLLTAEDWRPASRWESYAPLPLTSELLRELYVDLGLSIAHITMLCGVGATQVRNQLQRHGIAARDAHTPAPWNKRRASPN